jgi:hypothetical protein
MNTVRPRPLSRNESAIEMDMSNLRKKSSKAPNHSGEEAKVEVSALVFRISDQSISDVDDLIEGLQGLRKKLGDEGDRLERDIRSYAAFGESVVDFANIVSEGMDVVKSPNSIFGIDDGASGG